MTSILVSGVYQALCWFLDFLIGVLPNSVFLSVGISTTPVGDYIEAEWLDRILGYLNWCIPIYKLMLIFDLWLGAFLVYLVARQGIHMLDKLGVLSPVLSRLAHAGVASLLTPGE